MGLSDIQEDITDTIFPMYYARHGLCLGMDCKSCIVPDRKPLGGRALHNPLLGWVQGNRMKRQASGESIRTLT